MQTTESLYRSTWPIDSIFGLHGRDENDLSAAFAYALAASSAFLNQVVGDIEPSLLTTARPTIHIQTDRQSFGITDVEVRFKGTGLLVFEAKKGRDYPKVGQLSKYANIPRSRLIALTSVDESVMPAPLDWRSVGVPVGARSWKWVRRLARRARKEEKSSTGKFVLNELVRFLEGFVELERAYSNMVYVVSLGGGNPENWSLGWIEIVENLRRYFYPFGSKNWPSPPPNYLGFRYRGLLQSIHHVDSFEVVPDVREHFSGAEGGPDWGGPRYLITLGLPIRPAHEVRLGPRVNRSARVWCMLDALLTSSTISDALAITENRRRQAEERPV
jgi:hypothetical protein